MALQAATSFRGTKLSTRIVCTGVPQGSKLSPSLFNYYIADMPRPTPPVRRVCYADDITVWATGPNIPQLESMINSYLKDNSLLISASKSTVTLFTPDKHQFQMHPVITLEDTQLPLEHSPKILGVIMDPSLSFRRHWRDHPGDRIRRGSKRHSLQVVELSQQTRTAVQIVSNPPAPSNGGPIYRFLGMPAMRTRWMAGAAAHKSR